MGGAESMHCLTGRRTSSLLGCRYPLATGKPEIGGERRNVIEK